MLKPRRMLEEISPNRLLNFDTILCGSRYEVPIAARPIESKCGQSKQSASSLCGGANTAASLYPSEAAGASLIAVARWRASGEVATKHCINVPTLTWQAQVRATASQCGRAAVCLCSFLKLLTVPRIAHNSLIPTGWLDINMATFPIRGIHVEV
eukprot:6479101-Amphidinium_carterae.2